jgi:hypothetical protein
MVNLKKVWVLDCYRENNSQVCKLGDNGIVAIEKKILSLQGGDDGI